MQHSIDINCDMGERPEALLNGLDEDLMKLISSVNIACGYHAGDPSTMEKTISLAMKYNVGIGAHPGYPERLNFGRVSMKLDAPEISRLIYDQVRALGAIARKHHAELAHLKPHGALYHDADRTASIAAAIADGAAR